VVGCGCAAVAVAALLLLLVRSQKLSCLSLCNECAMQMQTSLANRAALLLWLTEAAVAVTVLL